MPRRTFSIAALALVVAIAAPGCGGDDTTSTTSEATTTTAATSTAPVSSVDMVMTEFKFAPDTVTVAAGKVPITQTNNGAVEHEFVLLKTDKAADSFPVSDGEMNEDTAGTNVGEIPDVAPGKSASKTFDLKPGKYVFVCNLPGHYAGGMYGSMTVR